MTSAMTGATIPDALAISPWDAPTQPLLDRAVVFPAPGSCDTASTTPGPAFESSEQTAESDSSGRVTTLSVRVTALANVDEFQRQLESVPNVLFAPFVSSIPTVAPDAASTLLEKTLIIHRSQPDVWALIDTDPLPPAEPYKFKNQPETISAASRQSDIHH